MSENVVNKGSEYGLATSRATNWRTAKGLQLSEIENCLAYIVVCACVCTLFLNVITRTVAHVDYCLSRMPSCAYTHDPVSRIKSAKQI